MCLQFGLGSVRLVDLYCTYLLRGRFRRILALSCLCLHSMWRFILRLFGISLIVHVFRLAPFRCHLRSVGVSCLRFAADNSKSYYVNGVFRTIREKWEWPVDGRQSLEIPQAGQFGSDMPTMLGSRFLNGFGIFQSICLNSRTI